MFVGETFEERSVVKISSATALILSIVAALLLFGCGQNGSESGGGDESKSADGYPERPVELIVPFAAGGPTDTLARALASAAKPVLNQNVVVVNRDGAGGTIAASEVANAKSDGYTVFIPVRAIMVAQPVIRDVQYSIDDFRGVTGLTAQPYVLTVRADSPWQTLEDLAKASKRIKYGIPAVGGFPDIAQAAFYNKAGVQADSVPFKGNAPALQALLGGQVDSIAAEPSVVVPQIEAGEIRPLAVTAPERLDIDVLSDVPTFQEKGYEGGTWVQTWSLLVPSETPDERVQVLQDAMREAVESQEFQDFAEDNYLTIQLTDGEELTQAMKDGQDKYAQLVSDLNLEIKPDN